MKRRDFLKLPAAALAPGVETSPKVSRPIWQVHLKRIEPNPANAKLFPGMGIATVTQRVTVSYEEDLSDIDWDYYELLRKDRIDLLP